jgi:hypothetical protein
MWAGGEAERRFKQNETNQAPGSDPKGSGR